MSQRLFATCATLATLLLFPACATSGPNIEARRKANDVCWKMRTEIADTHHAINECVLRVKKLAGVEGVRVAGNLVKVKFDDAPDEYGIWMK